jgi:hypothetical protein
VPVAHPDRQGDVAPSLGRSLADLFRRHEVAPFGQLGLNIRTLYAGIIARARPGRWKTLALFRRAWHA